MKQPVDHILRPTLPWRDPAASITECGIDATKVVTLSREQYFSRLREMGQQRAALFTCMTCSDTARRWGTWLDDPRLALQREIEWERGGLYFRARNDRGERLRDELLAIAELVERHRPEFDGLLREAAGRREWVARKAARAKPAPKDRSGL